MVIETKTVEIESYKRVVEALPSACVLVKANPPLFIISSASAPFQQLFQKSANELAQLPLFDAFFNGGQSSDRTQLGHLLEAAIGTKQAQPIQLHNFSVQQSGAESRWQVLASPIADSSGVVSHVLLTLTEKAAESGAAEATKDTNSAQQSYDLFMQAPVAVSILKGAEYKLELANNDMLKIWRKGPDIIGKPLLEALPEVESTVFPQLLDGVRLSGKPFHANESSAHFLVDGVEELVYFNFVYQPYYENGSEAPVGVLVVANEVTQQVAARKKVEESEQRYRTLISEAIVATAVYGGAQMHIQFANEAMIKLWGKDALAIGKTVREALPELEGQPFHQQLAHVYQTGETYWGKEVETYLMVDGLLQTFYFNFTYKALKNAEGEIYGILNMATDVTEQVVGQKALKESEVSLQKKVEERTSELRLKNKELEYINEELQQFAYIASHDLQEPLRKIRTFGSILSAELTPDAPLRKYVDKIIGSAERMSGLIKSLLDYSRLPKEGIRYEKVDLNVTLNQILQDYELLIEQKAAVINLHPLPVITGVPLQINQLFYNLIGNALKFSRRGVSPVISISAQQVSDQQKNEWELSYWSHYVEIRVEDNGIGFDQHYASKIFTIFQRLNDRSQYGGYGIGLALCKKVVDAHRGRIFAEGKLKEGALFRIILPLD